MEQWTSTKRNLEKAGWLIVDSKLSLLDFISILIMCYENSHADLSTGPTQIVKYIHIYHGIHLKATQAFIGGLEHVMIGFYNYLETEDSTDHEKLAMNEIRAELVRDMHLCLLSDVKDLEEIARRTKDIPRHTTYRLHSPLRPKLFLHELFSVLNSTMRCKGLSRMLIWHELKNRNKKSIPR
ncbi:hypothetical protein R1flu_012187 [Riccia fluitans]|uniref:Uncharacterized protein n=1 Tax=Riccia fluitans TaxID=41844 RepID=A0ABD1ZAV2_9MARC